MLGSVTLSSPISFASQPSRKPRMTSIYAAVAEVAPQAPARSGRKSLYEVLRVKRNASQVEIKTAYRTLAKLYHPDATARFMDSSVAASLDGRDFIEIHNAYTTLSDPDARAVYDSNLTVDSHRRWSTAAGLSGLRNQGRGRFNPTRRWETDQCW